MPEFTVKNVVDTLKEAGFTESVLDVARREHTGFVVYEDVDRNMIFVRYSQGVEGLGKRVNELVPSHDKNTRDYEALLTSKGFTCTMLDMGEEDRFPVVYLHSYNGEPFPVEDKGFDRAAWQRDRQEKERQKRLASLGYDAEGNPPSSFSYYGHTIEVGKNYTLDGGNTKYRGKVVKVLDLFPVGYKALVLLASGESVSVRMASIGPEVTSNTADTLTTHINGNGQTPIALDSSVLARLAGKLRTT